MRSATPQDSPHVLGVREEVEAALPSPFWIPAEVAWALASCDVSGQGVEQVLEENGGWQGETTASFRPEGSSVPA